MKKYIFMAAALMMMGMGMSSCSNDDAITEVEQAPKKVQLTLTATFDMGGMTRAEWDADGVTPKFVDGDEVGVYSENSATPELLEVSVDGDGVATLTGSVTPATTYHLVFGSYVYWNRTSYDKATGKISGFNNFQNWNGVYPEDALHYAMATSLETSVAFKPLCAIFKGADNVSVEELIYIQSANVDDPVITVDGIGGATLDATPYAPSFGSKYFLVTNNITITEETGNAYFAVAPGSVTLVKGSASGPTMTATVEAGKIYNVAP